MKADIRTRKESRFHPKIFEDLRGIALGTLLLSPLVAAGFGGAYGQNQELNNNRDAQAQALTLQRCELALGELAGKTVDARTIDRTINDACDIPEPSVSSIHSAKDQEVATISTSRYFVDLPSHDALNQAKEQFQADAQDNNPVIPIQYAGISFLIAAGYVTMVTVSRDSMQ